MPGIGIGLGVGIGGGSGDGYGAELLVNPNFAAWTADNPDGWRVAGESAPNQEISQVGSGEGHGGVGTGACNLYTDDGTAITLDQQVMTITQDYRIVIIVTTLPTGRIQVTDGGVVLGTITAIGTYTYDFTAAGQWVTVRRGIVAECDVTFSSVSCRGKL